MQKLNGWITPAIEKYNPTIIRQSCLCTSMPDDLGFPLIRNKNLPRPKVPIEIVNPVFRCPHCLPWVEFEIQPPLIRAQFFKAGREVLHAE